MDDQRRPAQGGSRARKLILDKVRQLGTTEHQEIFTLLRTHGIAYSSNSNGVFINLSTVPDDVLATVKSFVDYCAINKTGLDEYEKRLQECKITHKFDNISCPPHATTAPLPLLAPNPPSPPQEDRSPHRPLTVNSTNTVPSVLINGRFQATKKRFARKKIVDRKQLASMESDRADSGVLVAEAYIIFPATSIGGARP